VTWAPVYETAANLRTYMSMAAVTADAGDIAVDTIVLTPALTAASRLIDIACDRQFGLVGSAEDRLYDSEYSVDRQSWYIDIDDLMTVTGLVVKIDTLTIASTDYTLRPLNAAPKGWPWTTMDVPSADTVTVTASWGWTAVPTTIKNATLLQASRIAKRRDSPFGVAGSPDMGNELRLLERLDPDVALMVAAYRRYW